MPGQRTPAHQYPKELCTLALHQGPPRATGLPLDCSVVSASRSVDSAGTSGSVDHEEEEDDPHDEGTDSGGRSGDTTRRMMPFGAEARFSGITMQSHRQAWINSSEAS